MKGMMTNMIHSIGDEVFATARGAEAVGLDPRSLLSTVVYSLVGFLLLMVFAWIANKVFRLDLRRELIEDQNIGLGLALGGGAIAIAIVIAATIAS